MNGTYHDNLLTAAIVSHSKAVSVQGASNGLKDGDRKEVPIRLILSQCRVSIVISHVAHIYLLLVFLHM